MEFKIHLKTGDRFWTPKGLGALGMDPYRAIAELVANSLDWRREIYDNVIPEIEIIIGNGYIEVKDNGVGMTKEELQNAIQVSVANNDLRKNLRIRKGMFGMGMKVACLTLGWKITIHTRSIFEQNIENLLELDTKKLDGSNDDYRDNINGSSIPFIVNSPLGVWKSGTSIKIEDLTYKSLNPIALRDSLQEVFNPEIGIENIKILIIDKTNENNLSYLCSKTEVPIIEGSKIILDDLNLFVVSENKKEKLKGWLGLMKVSGSGSGEWGLHLFKNNQIIERFHQLPNRLGGLMPKNPHPQLARTYGEIHLDMCTPSFHKVGFDYASPEWKQVQDLLQPHLIAIMEASRKYKKSDHEKAELAVKKVQQHQKAAKKVIEKLKEHSNNQEKPDNAISLPDGRWFTIVAPIFKDLKEKNIPWIYNFSDNSNELAIIINTSSPVYLDILEKGLGDDLLETLVNWSISECLFFLLIDVFGFQINDSLNFRNQQLSKLYIVKERSDNND